MRSAKASSVKADRLLQQHRVRDALAEGEDPALIGPIYESRREPGVHLRVAFHYDEERRLCVGYARSQGADWELVESEPYSMRALAYYERRLKRIGEFSKSAPPRR